jgi:microcystin-dependent protein
MTQPYIGEIRMFAGNFAPVGWAFCQGQLMLISQSLALFDLIGTTYGGDGQQTFGIPDLRGRVPIHQGSGFFIGESGGSEEVTLTISQIPSHTHQFLASTSVGNANTPSNYVTADSTTIVPYFDANPTSAMAATAITRSGGSKPHDNRQPYLCVNFIISLFGIFPTQN